MLNPSHPGDLIQESLDGLRAETGQPLPLADVAERLGTTWAPRRRFLTGTGPSRPRWPRAWRGRSPPHGRVLVDGAETLRRKRKRETRTERAHDRPGLGLFAGPQRAQLLLGMVVQALQ